MSKTYDFAVIGAGVFGAWTAHCLRRSGATVVLLDAYGAANSRASSSGETRIIRMGYGPDELYTRWSVRSLQAWLEFFARTGNDLFHRTGVLWLGNDDTPYLRQLWDTLKGADIPCEKLPAAEIRQRWPELSFDDVTWAVLEPESGVLMARRAVQAVVADAVRQGVEYRVAAALPPCSSGKGTGKLAAVASQDGGAIAAGEFIFACGPWLPKLFPGLLAPLIHPTRQEVFFLGTPAGSRRFCAPDMPAWLHHSHPGRPYALPDIENRGFKIALDGHGPAIDPDSEMRVVSQSSVETLRGYLKQHIPSLERAPIVETRVCQYENTWNGDFLVDRHPDFQNVWIAGGGSGHGFKHGPALGEYVSARILHQAPAEPRFSLATKQATRMRAVY